MFKILTTGAALVTVLATGALAETFEVEMLNRGEAGTMVFEPGLVQAAPGDTIKFIATDKSHNAEPVGDMFPDGAESFAGKINEEFEVTLDVPGVYAVKCKPHFAMGMVLTIVVGDEAAPADFLEGRLPRKAKERFEDQLSNM